MGQKGLSVIRNWPAPLYMGLSKPNITSVWKKQMKKHLRFHKNSSCLSVRNVTNNLSMWKKNIVLTHGCSPLVEWVTLEHSCQVLESWLLFSEAHETFSLHDTTDLILKNGEAQPALKPARFFHTQLPSARHRMLATKLPPTTCLYLCYLLSGFTSHHTLRKTNTYLLPFI